FWRSILTPNSKSAEERNNPSAPLRLPIRVLISQEKVAAGRFVALSAATSWFRAGEPVGDYITGQDGAFPNQMVFSSDGAIVFCKHSKESYYASPRHEALCKQITTRKAI